MTDNSVNKINDITETDTNGVENLKKVIKKLLEEHRKEIEDDFFYRDSESKSVSIDLYGPEKMPSNCNTENEEESIFMVPRDIKSACEFIDEETNKDKTKDKTTGDDCIVWEESFFQTDLESLIDSVNKEEKRLKKSWEASQNNNKIEKVAENLTEFIIKEFLGNKRDIYVIKEEKCYQIMVDQKDVAKIFLKNGGAEDGIIMENNGKVYFIKIAPSNDKMFGWIQKLEEQKIFNFFEDGVSIRPDVYFIEGDKIYKNSHEKPDINLDDGFAIFVSEKSFIKEINFKNIDFRKNMDKEVCEKFLKNLLKIIFPTIILGINDVKFENCSFEIDAKNELTGNFKLIDIITSKSFGKEKRKYTNLFKIKSAYISKRNVKDFDKISVINNEDSFFKKLINIFQYTQSYMNKDENLISPFIDINSVAFLEKLVKYYDDNIKNFDDKFKEIKFFIATKCLQPFFKELKKEEIERFYCIDEVLNAQLGTIMEEKENIEKQKYDEAKKLETKSLIESEIKSENEDDSKMESGNSKKDEIQKKSASDDKAKVGMLNNVF